MNDKFKNMKEEDYNLLKSLYKDVDFESITLEPNIDSISTFLDLNLEDLKGLKNCDDIYVHNQIIKELANKVRAIKIDDTNGKLYIKTSTDLVNYFRKTLHNNKIEELHVVFLDRNFKIIHQARMEEGIENMVHLYSRKICKLSIDCGACYVSIAHNHPSNCSKPSLSDIDMTQEIVIAVKGIGVEFIDHLIVTNKEVFSFRDKTNLLYPLDIKW